MAQQIELTPTEQAEQALDTIIAEIRRLATENPDFVYESINTYVYGSDPVDGTNLDLDYYGVSLANEVNGCLYVHKAKGSDPVAGCIFGHAFMKLGYDLDKIKTCDRSFDAAGSIKHLVPELDQSAPGVQEKLNWCGMVQAAQDDNIAWGEAVSRADEDAENNEGDWA